MNTAVTRSFSRTLWHFISDVNVDSSMAVFHEICLSVGGHDFVGGTDAGEKRAVYGSRKELRGGFAREEDPVIEAYPYLSAQGLFGADRHIRVRAETEGVLIPSRYVFARCGEHRDLHSFPTRRSSRSGGR